MSAVMWCNESVLKIIKLYENYELLWHTGHRDYKNKLKKQNAWDSIAKTLDLPLKEVESKIHTIRSQFSRERKKLKKKSGSDDVKIKWFAYEHLLFLLKGETTIGDKDTIENYVEDNSSTEPQIEDSFTQHHNEDQRAEQTETITHTVTKVAKKRPHDENVDEIIKNVQKKLEDKDRDNRDNVYHNMTDEFDIYAKYVASELRNIKDEYSTLIAKQGINNILIDARIGKYRQECTTYDYRKRKSTPGTSSNDGFRNENNVQQKSEDEVQIKDEYAVAFEFGN